MEGIAGRLEVILSPTDWDDIAGRLEVIQRTTPLIDPECDVWNDYGVQGQGGGFLMGIPPARH